MRQLVFGQGVPGSLRLAAMLPKASPSLTATVAVLVLVSAALPVGFTLAAGWLAGAVPAAIRDGLDSPAGRLALRALALAGGLFAAQHVVAPMRSVVASMLGQDLDRHLEERVMRAVNRPRGIGHLEDPSTLDRIAAAQEVGIAGERPGGAVAALANIAPRWLQSVGYALALSGFRWWLGPAMFAVNALYAGTSRRVFVSAAKVANNQTAAMRRVKYFRELALTPPAAKEVRVYGLADWLVERFDADWLRAIGAIWTERGRGERARGYASALLTVANGLAYGYLGVAAVRGAIDLTALAILSAALFGLRAMFWLDGDTLTLELGTAALPGVAEMERLLADTHTAGGGRAPGSAAPSPEPSRRPPAAGPLRAGIRFDSVGFGYPGGELDVLTGLDLDIPAGTSLAIVGANGAGKTTLVKLLCRLYEPTAGRITADGVDLREIDAAAWQQRVAAIFQDFVRYELPARDNVGFGAVERAADERRLAAAARRAGALEIVEGLPSGWDTTLSRQYRGGADLSGGQWQRIALARALFAVDAGAAVLILDEPTASLDVRAEAELYGRFLEITRGLTTLLISHRFSTVRRADRICVLEGGRVAEQGTHDALMARGGRYAQMFTLQASRFRDDDELTASHVGGAAPADA